MGELIQDVVGRAKELIRVATINLNFLGYLGQYVHVSPEPVLLEMGGIDQEDLVEIAALVLLAELGSEFILEFEGFGALPEQLER